MEWKNYLVEVKTPDMKKDVIDPSPIRYESAVAARKRLDEAWSDAWVAESEWEEVLFACEWRKSMRLVRPSGNNSVVILILKEV